MQTLSYYQQALTGMYCKYCGADLSTRAIHYYDHTGGYEVEDFETPQWLYITCGCGYEWSLHKLGIK